MVLWDSVNLMVSKDSIIHFLFYAHAVLVNHLNPSCPVTLKGCQSRNSLYYTELFLKLPGDVQVWAILFFLQSKTQPSFLKYCYETEPICSHFQREVQATRVLLFGKYDRVLFICLLWGISAKLKTPFVLFCVKLEHEYGTKYNLFNTAQIIYTAFLHVQRVCWIYITIKVIYWYTL